MKTRLQKGQWVEGTMIHRDEHAIVEETGVWKDVRKYDESGAMLESIRSKDIRMSDRMVAVFFPIQKVFAVYPRWEVDKVKLK